jgi:hypothetical protein
VTRAPAVRTEGLSKVMASEWPCGSFASLTTGRFCLKRGICQESPAADRAK